MTFLITDHNEKRPKTANYHFKGAKEISFTRFLRLAGL
jgi:hypothetical protein